MTLVFKGMSKLATKLLKTAIKVPDAP